MIISKLRWQNIGDKHKGEGEIIVDGVSSNNLKLQLAFTGKELDELSGQAYVEANNIYVTPWLQRVLSINTDTVDSQINFQVWHTITNGMTVTNFKGLSHKLCVCVRRRFIIFFQPTRPFKRS